MSETDAVALRVKDAVETVLADVDTGDCDVNTSLNTFEGSAYVTTTINSEE